MEKTLQVLNDLEQTGVMSRYAIGGAMAAAFYVEPVATDDLDIFVVLPESKSGLLDVSGIYSALRERGYREEAEYVLIEGVPVQFLPVYDRLTEEALDEAVEIRYRESPARVLRAEHLAAIAVQTGRDKDRLRAGSLVESGTVNMDDFDAILTRYGLAERWKQWMQ